MNVEDIIYRISSGAEITFDESFEFCKECAELLRNEETALFGRQIVIHILDNWRNLPPATYEMWTDVIYCNGTQGEKEVRGGKNCLFAFKSSSGSKTYKTHG